jgi:hypothetical protein
MYRLSYQVTTPSALFPRVGNVYVITNSCLETLCNEFKAIQAEFRAEAHNAEIVEIIRVSPVHESEYEDFLEPLNVATNTG